MQRSEHYPFRSPGTNSELLDFARELLDELIGHALEDVEALYGQAGLAAIEEPPHARGARGLVQVRVVADDHGIRAPELQGGALQAVRRYGHKPLAGGRGARKGDLAYQGMLGERLPGFGTGPRHDVEHARRHAGFVHDLRYPQCGQRGGIGRLRYHDVARDQRGTQFVAEKRRREVPGHYRAYYSQRSSDYQAIGVFVEVGDVAAPYVLGEPYIVLQRVHEAPNLQARLAQRLALLGGQQRSQFLPCSKDGPRCLTENLATLRRRSVAPGRERLIGAPDRPIHLVRTGRRYGVHLLSVRRIDDGHHVEPRKVDVAAVDERLRHNGLLLRTW